MAVIRMWLNHRPQNITQKVHVQHRNCESGPAKCCTQAGPAHAAGHMEVAWTDEKHLFWHVLLVALIAVARRDLSPVTGTVSQATKTNGIERFPCGYLDRSRHWIGSSTSSLCPCCHNQGGRLLMVHVLDCTVRQFSISVPFLNICRMPKHAK